MLTKQIKWFGRSCLLACDGECSKAWGINSRPRVEFDPDEPDDYAFLADAAHGLPADLVVSLMRLHAADPASVTAVARVVAERLRQIEGEGWTPEHDDQHATGDMAKAAAAYALESAGNGFCIWPWDRPAWKPSTPERDRCKAMALLIAEDAKAIRAEVKS